MTRNFNLIVDSARVDIVKAQRADPQGTPINGGAVFYSEVIRALIRHSDADNFYFLNLGNRTPEDPSEMPEELCSNERLHFVEPHGLDALAEIPNAVFLTPTEQAASLSGVRYSLGMPRSPLISFLHAADPDWLLPHYEAYLIRGARRGDAMICSSKAGAKVVTDLTSLFGSEMQERAPTLPIIPLGTSSVHHQIPKTIARAQLAIGPEEVCILYFGRLEFLGKADLCPLLLLLEKIGSTSNLTFRVVCAGGDTPPEGRKLLRDFSSRYLHKLRLDIHPNPTQELKALAFASADIFVSPGDGIRETFGLTLLEAMSYSLPIVATDWSGYREIVEHGRNGFLIPTQWTILSNGVERFTANGYSHDEVLSTITSFDFESMQESLSALITQPQLRKKFGEHSAHLLSTKYRWEVIVQAYDNLFRQLLDRSRTSVTSTLYPFVQTLFQHYPSHAAKFTTAYSAGPLLRTSLCDAVSITTAVPPWVNREILTLIDTFLERTGAVSGPNIVSRGYDFDIAALHLVLRQFEVEG